MDFWLVLSKNDSNIICSSIKNESFLKIWRVWHILKVCHALWYLKIEMGIAGSIFELHPPNFQKMCIFWRFTNDISTIFCYLLWFQFWKKCQSLPVHPRVVPGSIELTSNPIIIWQLTGNEMRRMYNQKKGISLFARMISNIPSSLLPGTQ